MKCIQLGLFSIPLFAGLLLLGGCAQQATTSTGDRALSPAENQAAVSGDLRLAKDRLEEAASELNNQNDRSALDDIGAARDEMEMAAREADTDDPQLDAAIDELDSVKGMIERHEGLAESSLENVIEKIGQLANKEGENHDQSSVN